jgi:hypothetical protein
MAKSTNVAHLDLVQAFATGLLRPLGFRHRGRTYNRSTEPGIVQVINLQASQFSVGPEPGASEHNATNHGRFTVNLGVYIAEVHEASRCRPVGTIVHEYECAIRARLGEFLDPPEDRWWSLSEPESAAEEVLDLLSRFGEPLLARFATRHAIVTEWVNPPPRVPRSRRARLDVALILARQGRTTEGLDLIDEHLSCVGPTVDSHVRYVRELAARMAAGEFLPPDA